MGIIAIGSGVRTYRSLGIDIIELVFKFVRSHGSESENTAGYICFLQQLFKNHEPRLHASLPQQPY